jgi:hypothetical protein
MKISRFPKLLPPDGSIPKEAKFFCKTCKEWFASSTGYTAHQKRHPDHEMWNAKANRPVQHRGQPVVQPKRSYTRREAVPAISNGHAVLDATARDLLLDYVLGKAKEELNAELDRMFRELKSQPVPAKGRVYVAR